MAYYIGDLERKILLKGISNKLNSDDLIEFFTKKFGEVDFAYKIEDRFKKRKNKNKASKSRNGGCYGFVKFVHKETAEMAIEKKK